VGKHELKAGAQEKQEKKEKLVFEPFYF